MRFSLSSSHALLEMKCDMQISYEMVSNAHVHQLTVSLKLFDLKHLVDKTIEFVHAFLENFETAKEALRDSTRLVVFIVLAH